jgi:hypothetical protein
MALESPLALLYGIPSEMAAVLPSVRGRTLLKSAGMGEGWRGAFARLWSVSGSFDVSSTIN